MLYDVIIVGGGPAGMTAAIYSLRAGKKVLILERMMPGGQVAITSSVENYPGFKKIDGAELSLLMFQQVVELGAEIVYSDVLEYNLNEKIKTIRTHEGTFEGKTVILCMGASAKQLNLANEKKFLGKGVSYCATCDANFFKDKSVAIVGGGNTSLEDALYLTNIVNKVYLIHRRDSFRGDSITAEEILKKAEESPGKLELVLNSQVTEINGDTVVNSVVVNNKETKQDRTINVDGLFIAIGRKPDTELLEGVVTLDDKGYVLTDEKMKTNVPGVFAAGDIRQKQLRQIVTAAADGAIASININEYILETFRKV